MVQKLYDEHNCLYNILSKNSSQYSAMAERLNSFLGPQLQGSAPFLKSNKGFKQINYIYSISLKKNILAKRDNQRKPRKLSGPGQLWYLLIQTNINALIIHIYNRSSLIPNSLNSISLIVKEKIPGQVDLKKQKQQNTKRTKTLTRHVLVANNENVFRSIFGGYISLTLIFDSDHNVEKRALS